MAALVYTVINSPKDEEVHTIINPELKDIILQRNKKGGTDIKVDISDHIFTIKSIERLLNDENDVKRLFSLIIMKFNDIKEDDVLFVGDVFNI